MKLAASSSGSSSRTCQTSSWRIDDQGQLGYRIGPRPQVRDAPRGQPVQHCVPDTLPVNMSTTASGDEQSECQSDAHGEDLFPVEWRATLVEVLGTSSPAEVAR